MLWFFKLDDFGIPTALLTITNNAFRLTFINSVYFKVLSVDSKHKFFSVLLFCV